MIRALVIANSLGLGGAEKILESTVLSLMRRQEVSFTVCSLDGEGIIGRRLRARGVEVIALGLGDARPLSLLRGILAVRKLLSSGRFDLAHSFLYRSHFVCRLARLSLGLRPPLISAEHGVNDGRNPWQLRLNRLLSPLSDCIVAVSDAVRERLVGRDGVRLTRVTVIRNGVEMPRPRPRVGRRLRRALGVAEDVVVFLYLGRLHREKGPDVLLRALLALEEKGVGRWKLWMVGEGPQREDLERLTVELRLQKKVSFTCVRRTVGPWLEAADALVLPSREEGLPVAALEAMARGKPVIATRVGGTEEAVQDGRTGVLVAPEDPAGLACALQHLHEDPGLRRELGEEGRRRVRAEFSLRKMADETLMCYRRVLKGEPGCTDNSVEAVVGEKTGECLNSGGSNIGAQASRGLRALDGIGKMSVRLARG